MKLCEVLIRKKCVVTNLHPRATMLIDERCKNMCIIDMFTAHSDTLIELNVQGKNVEV